MVLIVYYNLVINFEVIMTAKSTQLIELETEFGRLFGSLSPSRGVASIDSLAVYSFTEYRKGHGTALYEQFLALTKGFNLICIQIHMYNERAIKFWQSKGFKYEGPLDQEYLEYTLELKG